MTLKCFVLDLKNDPELIEQYRGWHRPGGPPIAVTRSIRAAGIEDMQIFLSGNRLCMMVATNAAFSLERKAAADAADPEILAWETLMWTFQQPIPWSRPGEKWVEADLIYSLADQPA